MLLMRWCAISISMMKVRDSHRGRWIGKATILEVNISPFLNGCLLIALTTYAVDATTFFPCWWPPVPRCEWGGTRGKGPGRQEVLVGPV